MYKKYICNHIYIFISYIIYDINVFMHTLGSTCLFASNLMYFDVDLTNRVLLELAIYTSTNLPTKVLS